MEKTSIKSLIKKNRSYRRFFEHREVSEELLKELIELARLSASARNQQSLKYYISNNHYKNAEIFECLAWAGYLKDWDGPAIGERPAAYIIMLNDKHITENHYCDEGIAAQSILLGATEKELGGCIIGSVHKPKLRTLLNLPENLEIIQVVALGYPAEKVVIEDMKDGDFKYWRDKDGVHHVPKRPLEELIIDSKTTAYT